MTDALHYLAICSAVGLAGLDATAALQAMVSRPLVVGALSGLLLGDVALGVTVGGLIELLWVGGMPVGSLVPPDSTVASGLAAVVSIQLAQASPHPGGGLAASSLGVLLAVPAGYLGARAEILQRRLVGALSRQADAAAAEGSVEGLGPLLLKALGLAWLRGALAMALSLLLFYPLAAWILRHLTADSIQALQWCFWLFWLLGLAVAADHFWDRKGLKYAALVLLLLALAGARAGTSQMRLLLYLLAALHLLGLWRWWRALRGEATA